MMVLCGDEILVVSILEVSMYVVYLSCFFLCEGIFEGKKSLKAKSGENHCDQMKFPPDPILYDDSMRPLKWKCTTECQMLTKGEIEVVLEINPI